MAAVPSVSPVPALVTARVFAIGADGRDLGESALAAQLAEVATVGPDSATRTVTGIVVHPEDAGMPAGHDARDPSSESDATVPGVVATSVPARAARTAGLGGGGGGRHAVTANAPKQRAARRGPGPDRRGDPRPVLRLRRRLLGALRPRARVPVGLLRPHGRGRLGRAGDPRGVRRRRPRHHRRRGDAARDRGERRGDERLLGRAPHRVRAQPGREVRQRPPEGDLPSASGAAASSTSRSASPNPTPAPTPAASRRAPSPTARAAGASTAARSGPPRRWSRRSSCCSPAPATRTAA